MSDKYREAGVDLEAGYESVRLIKSHVARTKTMGAIDSIGAFGGMFDLSRYGFKEPVLVSGTDGVGTKLMIAFEADKHDTIGIDAVAMCVNDVLVQGAAPMFFLDYIAVGKNHPQVIEQIVKGVADGCVQAECALIGGETAEMPDMYDVSHYDIAGFCVGAVDKCNLLDGQKIAEGNVLIGLPSSGCHSNGFSLIRKVLLKDAKLDLHERYDAFDGKTLGEELLTPTKIYVKAIKHLLGKVDIKGMSHITGGGFYENIPRCIPDGLCAKIEKSALRIPPIFTMLRRMGNVSEHDMFNTYNMGTGMTLIAAKEDADRAIAALKEKTFAKFGHKGHMSVGDAIYRIQSLTIPAKYNIIRSEASLREALAGLDEVERDIEANVAVRDMHELMLYHELHGMLATARLTFTSALQRKESRGSHYREDYTETDGEHWNVWLKSSFKDGKIVVEAEPIPLEKFERYGLDVLPR